MSFHSKLLEKYMGNYFECPCKNTVLLIFSHENSCIKGKCQGCGVEYLWHLDEFAVKRDVSLLKSYIISEYNSEWHHRATT